MTSAEPGRGEMRRLAQEALDRAEVGDPPIDDDEALILARAVLDMMDENAAMRRRIADVRYLPVEAVDRPEYQKGWMACATFVNEVARVEAEKGAADDE